MAEPIEFTVALERILAAAPLWPVTRVPLQLALGSVLSEDVRADRDWPPFNRSMVDGYALHSAETHTPPATLRVIDDVPAGASATRDLLPGEAVRIMTGAPVPGGADAVVMQERTESAEPSTVRVLMSLRPGQNIARQAEDARAGAVVVPAGTELTPGALGILAFAGCASVPVRRVPRVAVLATGNELVEPALPARGPQIRNSNSYQLLAQCAQRQWPATYLGIVRDEPAATRRALEEGLRHDLLITTGGVSVGEHDYVGRTLRELGVSIAFDKVAIKPGKPTTFGVRDSTLVFGLPGNPVAAFVCFELFVRTAVRKAMGHPAPLPRFHRLPLASDMKSPGERQTFRPARLATAHTVTFAEPLEWHGSGHLAALLQAEALLAQPPGAAVRAGAIVDALLLD